MPSLRIRLQAFTDFKKSFEHEVGVIEGITMRDVSDKLR